MAYLLTALLVGTLDISSAILFSYCRSGRLVHMFLIGIPIAPGARRAATPSLGEERHVRAVH